MGTLKPLINIMGSDAVCSNNFYEENGSVMNNYYPNETNNTEENDLSNWEQENLQRIQNENNQRTNQEQQHQRYETMQQASHLKTHNERTKSYHHTTTAAARHQPKHIVVPQWNIPANLSSSYQRLYHDNHYGVAITAPPHLQHQPSITSVPTSSLPAHHGELQTFVHQTPNHSTPNPKRYQHQGLLSFSHTLIYSTSFRDLITKPMNKKKNMLIHVFMRASLVWCHFFG